MSITPQERELVTIGIAIACGCKTCLRQDMLLARGLHVTDKDIANTIKIAINVRHSSTDNVEKFISSDFTETAEAEPNFVQNENKRLEILVFVGTAFAVNCASSLKKYLASAKAIGIMDEELREVVGLAAFMKTIAASHVEQIMCPDEFDDKTYALADYSMPFGPEHCAWAGHCKPMTKLNHEEMEQKRNAGAGH